MTRDFETRIVSHDVGGRGFNVELKYPDGFADDVVHLLYEADAEAAAEMLRTNARPTRFVAPFCLGAEDGAGTLRVTANPYFSSLLDPDPGFRTASCEVRLSGAIDGVDVEGARYDALYAEECRVVRKVPVTVRALDSLRAAGELPFASPPDFLSIDTQGTEFEVMFGARSAIDESVLGLTVEVEFAPMYRGQKLFSSIFDFALEHGFAFAGFTYLQEVAPSRTPVGQRAREFQSFGDALFLRRAETLRERAPSADRLYLSLLKLAFISLCFERLGHTLDLIDQAERLQPGPALRAALEERRYYRLLMRLHEVAANAPRRFLHNDRGALVAALRDAPEKTAKGTAHAVGAGEEVAPLGVAVESILIGEGFHALAAEVRTRREQAQPYLLGFRGPRFNRPFTERMSALLRAKCSPHVYALIRAVYHRVKP